MSDFEIDDPLFDYQTYRFGRSRQIFRGPQPEVSGKYVAFIGSGYTFGRYSDMPFAEILGRQLEMTTLNLGTEGAGPGFFLGDPEVRGAASKAAVTVVEAMSASAISNRMFTVRPRRNSRLHEVSDLLTGIYPEVDFDRFAYTKPMLRYLKELDEARFRLVVNEMKNAWIGRTQTLLSSLKSQTLLFWFSRRHPDDLISDQSDPTGMHYPHYVDRAMLDAVKHTTDGIVECISDVGLPQDLRIEGRAVLFKPSGAPINENREMPSPQMHQLAAQMLLPEIQRLMDI
ncbi:MAG: DUF6473 family protein [Pseudomonadota bacterium]